MNPSPLEAARSTDYTPLPQSMGTTVARSSEQYR